MLGCSRSRLRVGYRTRSRATQTSFVWRSVRRRRDMDPLHQLAFLVVLDRVGILHDECPYRVGTHHETREHYVARVSHTLVVDSKERRVRGPKLGLTIPRALDDLRRAIRRGVVVAL